MERFLLLGKKGLLFKCKQENKYRRIQNNLFTSGTEKRGRSPLCQDESWKDYQAIGQLFRDQCDQEIVRITGYYYPSADRNQYHHQTVFNNQHRYCRYNPTVEYFGQRKEPDKHLCRPGRHGKPPVLFNGEQDQVQYLCRRGHHNNPSILLFYS